VRVVRVLDAVPHGTASHFSCPGKEVESHDTACDTTNDTTRHDTTNTTRRSTRVWCAR
jgi:hypothetical protein